MLKNVLSTLFSSKPLTGPVVPGPGMRQGRGEAVMLASADVDVWRDQMLHRFYQCMHEWQSNNFDREMFIGRDEKEFFIEAAVRGLKFFFDSYQELFDARARLADEPSGALLDRLLMYRMLGHLHVKVVDDVNRHWRLRDEARSLKVASAAEEGRFGALGVYDVPFENMTIRFTGWHINVAASFLLRQYYFERDGTTVRPEPGDFLIDAGACFGDTALAFAASAGQDGRVYAFDMVPAHCRIIESNLAANPTLAGRIRLFPFGVSSADRNAGAHAGESKGIDPAARLNLDTDPMRSIDSMVADGSIERIDFIKLDVEGSELDVLIGAEDSLRRWRPKLAISIYHHLEDYFVISDYLAGLNIDYRFFIDHYTTYDGETVLYAVSGDRV